MSFRNLFAATVFGTCVATASVLPAQQTTQPAQPRTGTVTNNQAAQPNTQAGQQSQRPVTDHDLASCLAIGNHAEIAVASFAKDKAEHQDVQEFAAMMVSDHKAFLQKLKQFAPEAAAEDFLKDDAQSSDRAAQSGQRSNTSAGTIPTTTGTVQQVTGYRGGHHADMLQVEREVAEQCIKSTKEELSQRDEKEFDKCFIGMQLAAHAQMKDKLIVFQRHVSPELKQVLAEGQKTTEQHLKKAEEIMKQLAEASEKPGAERQENRQERREDRQERRQERTDN